MSAPIPTGDLVPVNRRVVQWDPATGQPVVSSIPVLTKAQIIDIAQAAVSLPYEEAGDALAIEMGLPPSEFYGRPCMEVMLIRLAQDAARTGDKDKIDALLDRLLGKPKQTAEVIKTTMTYEDRLKEIALRRSISAKSIEQAQVEVIPPLPNIGDATGDTFED